MNNDINFGKFLSKLRKEKGYTQLQLAEIMHVTDKTISRWENNPGYPDVSVMREFSKIFNISMDELYAAKRLSREIFIRKRRRKRIIIAIISFFILALVFFALYFVANYNSVKFYTLYIENGNFDIRGGYYLESKERNLFQISEIEYLGQEDISDVFIKIYEKDGVILYSGINKKDIALDVTDNIDVDKLYLKINYSIDEKKHEDEFKIAFHIKYKNNKFVDKKFEDIKQNESDVDNDKIKLLEELGYKNVHDETYLKEEKNKDSVVKKYFNADSKNYSETIYFDNGVLDVTYLLNNELISFTLHDNENSIVEEFNYSYLNNKLTCLTKRCSKWDDDVEDVKAEISALQSIFN